MSFIHFIRKLNIYFGFSKCENCERKLGRYVTIIDGKRVCEICSKINQVDTMIKFIEMENDNLDKEIKELRIFQKRFEIFKPILNDIISGKYIKIEKEDYNGGK